MRPELHPISNILILGNGSWGSTIGGMLQDPGRYPADKGFSDPGYNICIYGPEMKGRDVKQDEEGNAVWSGNALEDAGKADLAVFAVPSVHMRATARSFAPYLSRGCYVLNLAKGIVYDRERRDIDLMHEIFIQELGSYNRPWVASLAGPNIAREIQHRPYRPTVTSISTLFPNKNYHKQLRDTFSVYRFTTLQDSPDILGLELSSALKNVIAFASGVVHGYYEEEAGTGNDPLIMNVIGSLIHIGPQEFEYMYHRIANAKGYRGRVPYVSLGDLVTTALSRNSRNFRAGYMRGQYQAKVEEKSIEEICEYIGEAVESVTTVESLAAYFAGMGWSDDFIVFKNIYRVMHDQFHIEESLDHLAEGHPRIARYLDRMESRARRNHERKKRETERREKTK